MKKSFVSFLSLVLVGVLLASVLPLSVTAATEKEYVIDNPYADVDWDGWAPYKTQLHCHTTASDGFLTIHEVIQAHYDYDYDCVAVTDHGTINPGWNNQPQVMPLVRLVKYERTKMSKIVPLTEQEYRAYQSGTAVSVKRTHRNGMLDIQKGIELNAATPKADCHLTGYYSDYGAGLIGVYGDYETPSAGVKEAGGISMLAHVGEFVYPEKDSENYVGQKVDDYYATKFARLFLDNSGSSVGMGINSATDDHTRCDRILYDQVLQKTIPNGVVPWGFTFSDSHNDYSINDAYTIHLMPENSNAAMRASMEKGHFFAVSHYSYGYELNGMPELPEDFEPDAERRDTPMITNISVNEENGTITVTGENFNCITWVSNGNVILREPVENGTATLNLHADNLLDEPTLYVRFYVTGDAGICYANPMVLHVKGEDFEKVDVPKVYDTPYKLRLLVTILDKLIFQHSIIVRLFKKLAAGY